MQEIFRTPLAVQPSRFRISHHSKILCIGSCFTENIGGRLETYRFPVMINPAGIQYNPDSVGNTIRRLIRNEEYRPDELHRDGDMWFSWDHHGSFSSTGRERCLEKINTALSEGAAFIREAEYLCITFGTAYGYTLTETGETVSN